MSILLLCLTALTLGLRHGLDLDHIAAMLDMTGTKATEESRSLPETPLVRLRRNIKLPALYVLGHGLMVAILGVTALAFGAVIPEWLDQIMERVVGITLLLLSVYLFHSLFMFITKGHELQLRSRWMLVFAGIARAWHWVKAKVTGGHTHHPSAINWNAKGSFIVGLLHGFGAETGTQVLLFASIVGSGSFAAGAFMLTAFTIGMSISTLTIALCLSAGLATSRYFKSVIFVLGVLAALFSLCVGLYFTFGFSSLLPSL